MARPQWVVDQSPPTATTGASLARRSACGRAKRSESRLLTQLDDGTNLHTHGLHVSPAGNSDNVLLDILPGETFDYEFAIPRDGTSGLYIPGFYWYHPTCMATRPSRPAAGWPAP
jgi:FtsP/CotA-like multicopper oxidase with cupredoxin domain